MRSSCEDICQPSTDPCGSQSDLGSYTYGERCGFSSELAQTHLRLLYPSTIGMCKWLATITAVRKRGGTRLAGFRRSLGDAEHETAVRRLDHVRRESIDKRGVKGREGPRLCQNLNGDDPSRVGPEPGGSHP